MDPEWVGRRGLTLFWGSDRFLVFTRYGIAFWANPTPSGG